MKQKTFKYKVGEIYLDKNYISPDSEDFFYTIKQIIDTDVSAMNATIYQFCCYHHILQREIFGWDIEAVVNEGKILLQEYLNAKKNEK